MHDIATLPSGTPEVLGKPVEVTALTRLKHAELFRASQSMRQNNRGGQSRLAEHLGVTPMEIGRWINLHECPPDKPTRAWPEARIAKLESDLIALTGKTLEELFPRSLRDSVEFLASPKRFEQTAFVHAEALERYAIATTERLKISQDAHSLIEQKETAEAVSEAVKSLPLRERQMLEMFYGLNGFEPSPLEQIGKAFSVTRERVRQVISKATRRLQQPKFEYLSDHYEASKT